MRPVHIGLLIAAGVLGGAFIMRQIGSQPAPAPAEKSVPAPAPAPAPAATEPEKPAAEPQQPSAFPERNKEKKPAIESRRKARPAPEAKPAETPVARNQPPATAPAPQTPAPEPPKETPASTPAPLQPEPQPAAPPAPEPPQKVTLRAGSLIHVRLSDSLSTDRNQAGDMFTATLAEPLVVDSFVIAERGARLEGRVVRSDPGGRVRGTSSIAIELTRLTTSDGQRVAIHTEEFEKAGQKSVGEDAAKVGAAAGIGAAIGAIAGGGKGAAIGAAIGGAAGTGGVMATRGKAARITSETKIDFRLRDSVSITERRR